MKKRVGLIAGLAFVSGVHPVMAAQVYKTLPPCDTQATAIASAEQLFNRDYGPKSHTAADHTATRLATPAMFPADGTTIYAVQVQGKDGSKAPLVMVEFQTGYCKIESAKMATHFLAPVKQSCDAIALKAGAKAYDIRTGASHSIGENEPTLAPPSMIPLRQTYMVSVSASPRAGKGMVRVDVFTPSCTVIGTHVLTSKRRPASSG